MNENCPVVEEVYGKVYVWSDECSEPWVDRDSLSSLLEITEKHHLSPALGAKYLRTARFRLQEIVD